MSEHSHASVVSLSQEKLHASMRVLVISNGHGEDAIGAALVRRLPMPIVCDAYPTIGAGHAYEGVCDLVGPRHFLPSEGVRRRGSLLKDLRAGLGIRATLTFLREAASSYDAILVVGDMIGVIFCWLAGKRVRVYLDVYKSGYANRYLALERLILRQSCDMVLTRDDILAEQLRKAGITAKFAGNAIMDTLVTGQYDAVSRRRHAQAVTILPGSRKASAANFALQVSAIRQLPHTTAVDLFAVLAPGTNIADLARASGLSHVPHADEPDSLGMLVGDGLTIHLAAGSLGAILAASDVVLGQGGTANLQAVGVGRPVISFIVGDARPARVRRIASVLGDSRITVAPDAKALSRALTDLLEDEKDRLRRGAIGSQRMGTGGAFAAVAEILLVDLADTGAVGSVRR